MAPKEGPRHPSKRAVPEAVTDVGSAHGTAEEDFQIEKDREIERLRLEIRRLRAEGARGRPQSSSADLPAAPIAEQRVAARERIEESNASLKEFLRYKPDADLPHLLVVVFVRLKLVQEKLRDRDLSQ